MRTKAVHSARLEGQTSTRVASHIITAAREERISKATARAHRAGNSLFPTDISCDGGYNGGEAGPAVIWWKTRTTGDPCATKERDREKCERSRPACNGDACALCGEARAAGAGFRHIGNAQTLFACAVSAYACVYIWSGNSKFSCRTARAGEDRITNKRFSRVV